MLADLDIAIVERASDHALVLVEVEETTDRAKVLIGDVFTALLGSGVSHLGRQLYVGAWTTLAVVARLRRAARADRLPFIEEQVMALKAKLTTPNAVIGRVLVRGYGTDAELEAVLLDIVQSATHR
ncbi:MAG: hypothetical protein IT317_22415 [Anaerolineales bacterium]|nr:hypothetical protein [Anaerolineales bacterium]